MEVKKDRTNGEGKPTAPAKTLDDYYKIARFVFVMLLVVALGIYIIRGVMDYRYKVVFIKQPCQLCQELNPDVKDCFTRMNTLYPNGMGGWRFGNGSNYGVPTPSYIINSDNIP